MTSSDPDPQPQPAPRDPAAPKVGVVVAAYNTEAYIGEAVRSVLAQTAGEWELIVMDDGSTDATADEAERAAGGDPRVRVVRQANAGRSAARNRGEAMLSDDVTMFMILDADDALEPRAIEVSRQYLMGHPQVGCVGFQFIPIDPDGKVIDEAELPREKRYRTRWAPNRWGLPRELGDDEVVTPLATFITGSGVGPHALFRRSIFRGLGGYDTQIEMWEDRDLYMRLALRTTIHYLPDRLYRYRLHPTQSTANRGKYEVFRRRMVDKWRGFVPEDPRQRQSLAAARAYNQLVHVPLRHAREVGREVRKGKYPFAAWMLLRSTKIVVTWPWYLLRWSKAVSRDVSAATHRVG